MTKKKKESKSDGANEFACALGAALHEITTLSFSLLKKLDEPSRFGFSVIVGKDPLTKGGIVTIEREKSANLQIMTGGFVIKIQQSVKKSGGFW